MKKLQILLLLLGATVLSTSAFAASSTLSNLSAGGAVSGTDIFYDVQTSGTGGVKVTGTQLQTFMGTVVQTGPGATGGTCNPGSTCTIATQELTTHTLTGSGAVQTTDVGGRIVLNDASSATLTLENLTNGQFTNVYNEAAGTWTLSPNTGSISAGCTTVPQNWWAHIGFDGTNYYVGCGPSTGGAVTSVFTRTGAVTATSGDYTAAQVTGAAAFGTTTGNTSGDVVTMSNTTVGVQDSGIATSGGKITVTSIAPAPLAVGSSTGNTVAAPYGYFVCTAACTVTPPVPAAGYQFCVMNADNATGAITLGAIGSSARYENTARTAYGTAGTGTLSSGGAVGDMICIIGLDSTHYLSPTYVGTWTAS